MLVRSYSPGRVQFCFVILFSLVVFTARVTRGQSSDPVRAETLFQQAVKLMDEGRAAEACPKFAASHKLDPSYGAVFNLAECYSTIGKIASAWTAYLEAAAIAKRLSDPKRDAEATERAKVIETKLIRITVSIAQQVPDIVVKIDDTIVDHALFGVPFPVDPGSHLVSVERPGYKPWSTSLSLDTPGSSVLVAVPTPEPQSQMQPAAKEIGLAPSANKSVEALRPGSGFGFWGLSLTVVLGSVELKPSDMPRVLFERAHLASSVLIVPFNSRVSLSSGPFAAIQTVGQSAETLGTPFWRSIEGGFFATLDAGSLYGMGHLVGPRITIMSGIGVVEGGSRFEGKMDFFSGPTVSLCGEVDVVGVRIPERAELTIGAFGDFSPLFGYFGGDHGVAMNSIGVQISAR